jgi:hypothetical protein
MCPKQIGGSGLRAEVGQTDARNGHHVRTHVDGTDARRAEHPHFLSQVVDRQGLLDSDPQCLVTRKFCQMLPLAESQAFGLAPPDAGRMQCPTETLGEGKGERTAGKGREAATGEES